MRSLETPVLSHWHKLVPDFEASALDFYAAVEAAVRAKNIPDVRISRVEYKEGGILSASRLYLRITRRRVAFDICAAPFGQDYFFSSWLVETKPKMHAWGCLIVLALFGAFGFVSTLSFGTLGAEGCFVPLLLLVLAPVAVVVLLGLALVGVRGGWFLSEDVILMAPYLGPIYEYLFSPPSYYKHDTALMFQESVHGPMLGVVDQFLEGKGLRSLAPEDRKPVTRALVR